MPHTCERKPCSTGPGVTSWSTVKALVHQWTNRPLHYAHRARSGPDGVTGRTNRVGARPGRTGSRRPGPHGVYSRHVRTGTAGTATVSVRRLPRHRECPHHVEASADPCRKRHGEVGKGLKYALTILNVGRGVSIPAICLGMAKAGMATDHRPSQCPSPSRNRWQSGKLSRFGWATWPGISLPWKRWPCWSGDLPINTGTTYGSKRPWPKSLLGTYDSDFSGMPRFCSAAWVRNRGIENLRRAGLRHRTTRT